MYSVFILICTVVSAEPDVLWSAVTNGGVYCSADMGDLNGDSVSDIACGLYYFESEPTLWAVSGADGSTIWTSSIHKGIYQNEGFKAVPDMTGDGVNELLMATPGGYAAPGRCLYLISGADGSTVWEWAACEIMPSYTGWGYSSCLGDDVSGDGVAECYGGFGTSGSANTGLMACINGATGDSLWTQWMPDAVETLNLYEDVDGDGVDDILAGIGGNHYTNESARLISGADGSVIWQKDPGGDCMSIGLLERTDTYPFVVFSTFDGTVACYDGGGTLQWDYTGSGMYLDVAGGPDITGDGVGEVALAADNAGAMCLSGADGSILWTYPAGSNTWSVCWIDPVILQGSPVPCIAAGSVNGRSVSLINSLDGQAVWEMPFTERVYNVASADLGLPSPVVVAGLQDQESLPYHAWALISSDETGISSDPAQGQALLSVVNPCSGSLSFTVAGVTGTGVQVDVFDISGRLVFQETYSEDGTIQELTQLRRGMYILKASSKGESQVYRVTVL